MADVRKIIGGLSRIKLPPAENSRLTQIATTGGTYEKARDLLDVAGATKRIDYGAGRGHGANIIGGDSFEPYAPPDFMPTFRRSADIPSDTYDGLTNLNVLNVLDQRARDEAVEEMGRILRSGGTGIITTRGRDVMSAKGVPGPEPMSLIIGEGDRARYQKGFRQDELLEYLQKRLGSGFNLDSLPRGAAGARVDKKAQGGLATLQQGGQPPRKRVMAPKAMTDYLREVDPHDTLKSEVRNDLYKNTFGHGISDIRSMTHEGEGAAAPDPTAPVPMSPMAVKVMGNRVELPVNAPTAVSDLVEGTSDMMLPQTAGDLALGAVLSPVAKPLGIAARSAIGGMGLASDADAAEAGFGGLRYAPTHIARKIAEAREMVEKGATHRDLWDEKQIYFGRDGKPRWEIDDSGAELVKERLLDGGSRGTKLRDVLRHEQLYRDYPDIGDIPYSYNSAADWGAAYTPRIPALKNREEIQLGPVRARSPEDGPDYNRARGSILHEVQHALQSREGFSPGSSPQLAGSTMMNDLRRARDPRISLPDADRGLIRQIEEAIKSLPSDVRDELNREAYLRHFGEMEARAAQKRQFYDPSVRDLSHPFADMGVSISKTIDPTQGISRNLPAYSALVTDMMRLKEAERAAFGTRKAEGGSVSALDELVAMVS